MSRRLLVPLTLMSAGLHQYASAEVALPDHGSTATKLSPQETTQWCWAASGQMVMAALGRDVTQCVEAQKRLGRSDCCGSVKPDACVKSGWPEFGKYGFTFATTSGVALSWDELRSEVATYKSPVAFSWHWRGGGNGHMMVVQGFEVRNSVNYVSIFDPWPPNVGDSRDITYDNYVAGANHTHWNDYYKVRLEAAATGAGSARPPPPADKNKDAHKNNKMSFNAALAGSRSAALKLLMSSKAFVSQGPGAAPAAAKVGVPFPNVYVGIDALQAAAAPGGPSASELLQPQTDQVLYSIEANGEIKDSLLMQKTDNHWDDSGEANTAVTRQLVATRRQYAETHHLPLTVFHSVSIPALNAYFVAVKSGADTILIPVQTDASIGVVAGEAQPAAQLLPKLAAAAAEADRESPGVR